MICYKLAISVGVLISVRVVVPSVSLNHDVQLIDHLADLVECLGVLMIKFE